MSTNSQKKYCYFEEFKKYLYIVFVLCFFFYTAFKVSLWNDATISYYFEKIFSIIDFLKIYILIPLLFLSELITVFIKCKNKGLDKKYLITLFIYLAFYLMMKRYAYYWRFDQLIVFLYFAKYLEFDKIMYLYVAEMSISAICNIVGCLTGYLTIDLGKRGLVLGFSHYNQAGIFYSMLYFGIAYCLRKHRAFVSILSLPFLYLIHFVLTSRTPFVVIIIFVCLLNIEPIYKKISKAKHLNKIFNFIYIIFPILMTGLAICLGILLCNGKIAMDSSAAIRFQEFVYSFNERGLATYYRDLLDSSRHFYFDNGYAQLIFKHGLIPTFVIYSLWILNGIKVSNDKNYFLIVLNFCLFTYMMMEFIILNDLILIMMTYYTCKKIITTLS